MLARLAMGNLPLEVATQLYPVTPTTAGIVLFCWHVWTEQRKRRAAFMARRSAASA